MAVTIPTLAWELLGQHVWNALSWSSAWGGHISCGASTQVGKLVVSDWVPKNRCPCHSHIAWGYNIHMVLYI